MAGTESGTRCTATGAGLPTAWLRTGPVTRSDLRSGARTRSPGVAVGGGVTAGQGVRVGRGGGGRVGGAGGGGAGGGGGVGGAVQDAAGVGEDEQGAAAGGRRRGEAEPARHPRPARGTQADREDDR